MPAWRSRGHVLSFEVLILVTAAAGHGGDSISIATAPHVHGVRMSIVSLPRKVSVGMAIHTARMMQHWHYSFERTNCGSIIKLRCGAGSELTLDVFISRRCRSNCHKECQAECDGDWS
jgi:hypothetical protein